MAAVFVTNLIKRHPNCKVLLHRQATDDRDNITANTDPFDLNEPDPAKCAALESSLWELKVCCTKGVPHVCIYHLICMCMISISVLVLVCKSSFCCDG